MKKLTIILLITLLINTNFTTNANAFVGEIGILIRSMTNFWKEDSGWIEDTEN